MQIYQKDIVVGLEDLDQLNHVNNVRYVQWVQDIAQAHWLQNATKAITEHFYWVLLRHTINYKDQAFLNDKLTIKTFVTHAEGFTSLRSVEMINATTGKLIADSETKWCLMQTKTKRPTRITNEIAALFI